MRWETKLEILLFLADTLAVFVLIYTSLRNDKARPGEALVGPFRYDAEPKLPAEPPETARVAAAKLGGARSSSAKSGDAKPGGAKSGRF